MEIPQKTKSRTTIKVKVKVKSLSRVQLFATPQTVTHQAPLSMGFPRQEYWSGLRFPPPGASPGGSGKESPGNAGDAGDVGLIPGSRGSPREGNRNPLQYSCLENPMDRRAW